MARNVQSQQKPEPVAPARRYVIAENRQHAKTTLLREWGFAGRGARWLDLQGHPVTFISSVDQLDRLPEHSVVYRAYRWYAWVAPHVLEQIGQTRHLQFVDKPSA